MHICEQIALAAQQFSTPLYVVAESYKFTRIFPLNQKDLPEVSRADKVMICISFVFSFRMVLCKHVFSLFVYSCAPIGASCRHQRAYSPHHQRKRRTKRANFPLSTSIFAAIFSSLSLLIC